MKNNTSTQFNNKKKIVLKSKTLRLKDFYEIFQLSNTSLSLTRANIFLRFFNRYTFIVQCETTSGLKITKHCGLINIGRYVLSYLLLDKNHALVALCFFNFNHISLQIEAFYSIRVNL